jgi:transposase
MSDEIPKTLTACRRFFLEPELPKQRMYEALRAYFLEGRPSREVARAFGYSPGSFRVLCHQFRRDPDPKFFIKSDPGPRVQPKKSAARNMIEALRKQNYSVYEISALLKEQNLPLSPTAVGEVLKEMGFAPLPRRLDHERPDYPRPSVEPIADARKFEWVPRRFQTICGGLFLFIPDLVNLNLSQIAQKAKLPGSRMIPAEHALRACLGLKLWSIHRKSHVMPLVADEGLALFAGLNCFPKKSFFSEYSSVIEHDKVLSLLTAWHDQLSDTCFSGKSFNLDFHSIAYHGEHPVIERHYVPRRSRRQPSVLVFLAQDPEGNAFCYSNADIRKGEEAEEIFRFIDFWKRVKGKHPAHLVFDSKLTTYANLGRLDEMGIAFITLRRRSHALLKEIETLPPTAWRRITLPVPTRKWKTPRYFEQPVKLAGHIFRQLFIVDLGHDEPTILLSNDRVSPTELITRYAKRMIIENAISDAIRFFSMDALSSAVGLKVDFDLSLLVMASGLYRQIARRMRGYADKHARLIFRDIIDMPATVQVTADEVIVRFHRRTHLPIISASGMLEKPVSVPWWKGMTLRLSTDN